MDRKRKSRILLVAIFVLGVMFFYGCQSPNTTPSTNIGDAEGKPVVVATMLDSEGSVLGKMIIELLTKNGIEVVDKVNFGTPDILRKALENGEVDLVVDYTGSGQYYHPEDALDTSIWQDPVKGYEFTAKLDKDKKNIIWLEPAKANNTEMIAITKEFAKDHNINDMVDLASYINDGNAFRLICSASFAESPLGLVGYEKAYGFKLKEEQLIILASGNTAEMLKALSEGINDVNASLVYGTDGALDKMNLLVVADPKLIPPVYLPTPVIRGDVLTQYPSIAEILKPVFENLTIEDLQILNAKVAYEGQDPTEVAKAYLKEKGYE